MSDATAVLHMHTYVTHVARYRELVPYVPSYLDHGYYPCLESHACILRDPFSSSLFRRTAPVVMAKGLLSQLDRENVQNMKRVPFPDSFLATSWARKVRQTFQLQCWHRLKGYHLIACEHSGLKSSGTCGTRLSSSLHTYDVNEQTIVPLHVIRIMCLSRYFPEIVCTALYGVEYSLSLYYLLICHHVAIVKSIDYL